VVYDVAVPGFGCRITPAGARAWTFDYRPGGGRGSATRRMTLGRIEILSYAKARKTAEEYYHRTRLGEDPAGARDGQRAALTVASLVDRFMREEVVPSLKPTTVRFYKLLFRKHVLPAIGRKRAIEVSYADVAKLHRALGRDDKQITANRVKALISALYGWAGKAGEVPRNMNPTDDVTSFRETPRTRFLSDDEIGRLGETLTVAEMVGLPYTPAFALRMAKIQVLADDPRGDAAVRAVARATLTKLKASKIGRHAPGPAPGPISKHVTGAIRLLLLSGCRLSEILNLRWSDVDIARGLLVLPDSKTGPRPVWLSAAALAVIETLAAIRTGDYVIAGDRPDLPRSSLKRPWDQIVKHAKLDGVTLHTLRHTNASVGVGAGIGLPLVGALLGHRVSRTTHIANAPARQAAEMIGVTITAALERRRP
jgi:integrase